MGFSILGERPGNRKVKIMKDLIHWIILCILGVLLITCLNANATKLGPKYTDNNIIGTWQYKNEVGKLGRPTFRS